MIDAKPEQQQRDQEGMRQPQRQQVVLRHHSDEVEHAGREQIADGDAERGETAVEAALARGREFHCHDDGAAVFGAGAEALQQPQQQQQDRCPDADRRIGRQQADQEGAAADQQQGRHQHRLAAHPVAEMAEEQAAERARQEADGEGGEGRQRADGGIVFREEQLAEHQRRRGAVDEEVVPLERRTDGGRQHDVAERTRIHARLVGVYALRSDRRAV